MAAASFMSTSFSKAASFVPDFVDNHQNRTQSITPPALPPLRGVVSQTGLTLQIPPQIFRPETVRQRGLARDAPRARHLRKRLLHRHHAFRPAR